TSSGQGYDDAWFYDTSRNEDFVFTPNYGIMRDISRRSGPSGSYAAALGFDSINFRPATNLPDNDIAWIYGSTSVDMLTVSGSLIQFASQHNQLLHRLGGYAGSGGFTHFPDYQAVILGASSTVVSGGGGAMNLSSLQSPTIAVTMSGFTNLSALPVPA